MLSRSDVKVAGRQAGRYTYLRSCAWLAPRESNGYSILSNLLYWPSKNPRGIPITVARTMPTMMRPQLTTICQPSPLGRSTKNIRSTDHGEGNNGKLTISDTIAQIINNTKRLNKIALILMISVFIRSPFRLQLDYRLLPDQENLVIFHIFH